MAKKRPFHVGIFLVIGILAIACQTKKLKNWTMGIAVIGTHSSPRVADLNGDGIKDIIIGAGQNEFQTSEYGVLAINGATGEQLWSYPCTDQVFGSAVLIDITEDDVMDVIISGRSHQLFALDGKTGAMVWKFDILSHKYSKEGLVRFNFYNPVLVEDYSGDQVNDLLVVNGGNVNAATGESKNRYPGTIMIMNAVNGELIALDTMPDGKESYLTPTYVDFDNDGTKEILFGTGGETITGGLYCTDDKTLLTNDISSARKLIEYPNGHGFVAPPVIVDITADGILDIVALDHGGIITALSGVDFQEIWKIRFDDLELNAQPSVGHYNQDDIPDLFVNGASGKWPENTGSRQFFIDGKTGEILIEYNQGCAGFASSVSLDLNSDQLEEVILPINEYECQKKNSFSISTWLQVFGKDTTYQLTDPLPNFKNISSTPWVGDLDGDSQVELVYIVNQNLRVIYEFFGLKVNCLNLDVPLPTTSHWNQYLGPQKNNVILNRNSPGPEMLSGNK